MKSSIALMLIALTCTSMNSRFGVRIYNSGSADIRDARVSYAGFSFLAGVVPPRVFKRHGSVAGTPPETADVEWRTADGVIHHREVRVRSLIPDRFDGDIQFDIGEGEEVRISQAHLPPSR